VQRQPIFNVPASVLAIMLTLATIHAFREYWATEELDAWILSTFSFVPGRFTFSIDPAGVADSFSSFTGPGAIAREEIAKYFLGDGQPLWWTPLTYSGLHADWTHCGVNSLWLVAFGAPVARRFGSLRFIALFFVTAIAGAAAHWLAHRYDLSPVVGASASVSGAMAAATRFVFQPNAPLGLGAGADGDAAFRQPALPLRRVFTDSRALPFLIMWFGLNLLFGLISAPLGITQGPVAWEAHVGGFLAGLLLFPLFDPPSRFEAAPRDDRRETA
jgi:membrane associated rhomboid family serine protease